MTVPTSDPGRPQPTGPAKPLGHSERSGPDEPSEGGQPLVPEISHEHMNVTGGWLRPAVFGAMDGLVSNFSLIAGVTGAGVSPRAVAITGIAGLFAGAFSMASGEWVSVRSQAESADAELSKERTELDLNPEGEIEELAEIYISRGVDRELALRVVRQMHADPQKALEVHALEEMGIDPDDMPSPWIAAISSFLAFSVGAFVPLVPFLFGASNLLLCSIFAASALFAAGAITSRFTSRSWWFAGGRQLLLGGLAAVVTYLTGLLVGSAGL